MTTDTALALLAEAKELLNRYWREVPLGNQPHMIAADAESCVSRIDALLSEKVEPVEWIKCSDTLPTPHKDYWLCIEGAKFATIGRLNHQFNEDLYWCLENGNKGNDLPYAEVTQYAEIVRPDLPALPEDK